jgi:hypothetical protein
MSSFARRIGVGAICAIVIASASVVTYSPANARHLRVERLQGPGVHWRSRTFYPPIIGGFALGAATYPYYGFSARYYESLAPWGPPIVLRSRY